jgi:hypothetical protein
MRELISDKLEQATKNGFRVGSANHTTPFLRGYIRDCAGFKVGIRNLPVHTSERFPIPHGCLIGRIAIIDSFHSTIIYYFFSG